MTAEPMSLRLQHKHSFATRWTHWINFPILFAMIWSGLLIYWANDVYRVGFGRLTLFHFFPDWIYNQLHLGHRLAEGMAVHFYFMWLFAINGLLYVAYTVLSGAWRDLVPDRRSFPQAIQVLLHDLGLRKTSLPAQKYNGAQKIVYSAIVLMGAGSLVTGLSIYRPTQLAWLTSLLGGYPAARFEHFCLTMGYLAFFAVHMVQVIRAGWNNFRSMLTGLELAASEKNPTYE